MARKTPISRLNEAISGILSEYAEDLGGNLGKIVEEMGKKGAQALKQQSRQQFPKGSGAYAQGWKAQADRGRLNTTSTIYNEHPGLPHLLEYGHVSRNGTGRTYGSVPGREHIQTVADELVQTFENEVMAKL